VLNVLSYEAELIIDGRTLKRPVNYGLVHIVLPEGVTSIHAAARLSLSIRAQATGQALAGLRRIAKSGSS
jgi:hypothetical protein